ncbi:sensor domain-containing diguanylate cyclase [Brevibacillus laterosporus]|nr:sensor domain-containing diguanylate cyclase [Brevibacillus laterosporus]TPG82980.1 sensor domain-containing diguanylate cyclase [Brevibacillus laterosporus]
MRTRTQIGTVGKLFDSVVPFFLPSWPIQAPGLLFFATPGRGVIATYELGTLPAHLPPTFFRDAMENLVEHEVPKAWKSGQVICKERVTTDCGDYKWLLQALGPQPDDIHAIAGILTCVVEAPVNIQTYGEMVKGLYSLGYKGFIQRMASEIVVEASKCKEAIPFMKTVVTGLHDMVGRGHCSLIKLDENGYLLPQERFTTDPAVYTGSKLHQVLNRFVSKKAEVYQEDSRVAMYPIYVEGEPIAALLLHVSDQEEKWLDRLDMEMLHTTGEQVSHQLHRTLHMHDILRESQKKELLYQLTKQIHASIDVNDVLAGVLASIKQLYPYFSAELYLTMEMETNLPIKTFSLQKQHNQVSQQAYFEGKLIMGQEEMGEETITFVAAPLHGRQGIYGILQLATNEIINLSSKETEYISILAETAGSAFENAQLYQQSRDMVRELRLINEMAQQINRSLNMIDILEFVTKMLHRTFDASYSAILQKAPDGERMQIISSSKSDQVGQLIPITATPISEIFIDKRKILPSPDCFTNQSHHLFPYQSVMGVPLLQDSEVSGLLIVADHKSNFFTYDDYKLLELFGQHTSLAITNALLLSEVERMVITDNLTGLFTRRYLNENVKKSLLADEQGSLILIDIDYFKKINDTYGHLVGDEILHKVASVIKNCIRDSDIPARWGGEEIAIYLPHVDVLVASKIAERIRIRVQEESKPSVTISSGVAMWSRDVQQNRSAEELLHDADVALYKAKQDGRNLVRKSDSRKIW